jgi:hypothetical protein
MFEGDVNHEPNRTRLNAEGNNDDRLGHLLIEGSGQVRIRLQVAGSHSKPHALVRRTGALSPTGGYSTDPHSQCERRLQFRSRRWRVLRDLSENGRAQLFRFARLMPRNLESIRIS